MLGVVEGISTGLNWARVRRVSRGSRTSLSAIGEDWTLIMTFKGRESLKVVTDYL